MGNPLIQCLRDVSPQVDCTERTQGEEEIAEMPVSFQDPHTSLDLIHTLQTPAKTGSKRFSSQPQLQPSALIYSKESIVTSKFCFTIPNFVSSYHLHLSQEPQDNPTSEKVKSRCLQR